MTVRGFELEGNHCSFCSRGRRPGNDSADRFRGYSLLSPNSSADCSFDFVMRTTLAHQLADYACALNFEDLSPEVVREVKRRVIDSLGCALGAWDEEPCAIARKVVSEFSAKLDRQ